MKSLPFATTFAAQSGCGCCAYGFGIAGQADDAKTVAGFVAAGQSHRYFTVPGEGIAKSPVCGRGQGIFKMNGEGLTGIILGDGVVELFFQAIGPELFCGQGFIHPGRRCAGLQNFGGEGLTHQLVLLIGGA